MDASDPEPPKPSSSSGCGRVLVVDDVDLVRDFTRNFLKAAGCTVIVANSGSEALKILEETSPPPDILLTDYNMPGMSGVELIDQVALRWPEIHLILTSGYLDEKVSRRLDDLEVNVLAKPYEIQDAAALIMRLLHGS